MMESSGSSGTSSGSTKVAREKQKGKFDQWFACFMLKKCHTQKASRFGKRMVSQKYITLYINKIYNVITIHTFSSLHASSCKHAIATSPYILQHLNNQYA